MKAGKKDKLAAGAASAMFGPSAFISQEKWDLAFGKRQKKKKRTAQPPAEAKETAYKWRHICSCGEQFDTFAQWQAHAASVAQPPAEAKETA